MYIKKYKKFLNESVYIDKPELFEEKFGIKHETLEDYLTELSDNYIVTVFENINNPRIRAAIISMKKIERVTPGFTIVIANSESGLSENKLPFNKNDILQKMESVCVRLKEYSIKFHSFNVVEGSNGYMFIEYKFVTTSQTKNFTKFNENFRSTGLDFLNIENIEDYLIELSDKYEVDIIKLHPIRKLFSITIVDKEGENLSLIEKEDIEKSMETFIKRSGFKLAIYGKNPSTYTNGVKYVFEIK